VNVTQNVTVPDKCSETGNALAHPNLAKMFQKTVTVVQPKNARPASAHHAVVPVSGKSGVLVMDHADLDTENERSETPVPSMPTENRHHHKLKPKTVAKRKDAPTWNGKNGANATLNATLSGKN